MHSKVSKYISIMSVVLIVILIAWFYLLGGIRGLEGVAWILGILGAPLTFLDFFLFKFNITRGFIPSFIAIVSLYLLQYQLIALMFRKNILNLKTKIGLLFTMSTIILIAICATAMAHIIFAKPKI
jgi:uncharacterized membrane protein